MPPSPRCRRLPLLAGSRLRTLGLVALVLVVTGATEARAQGGYNPAGDIISVLIVPALVLEVMTLGTGVVTGAGMTHSLTRDQAQRGWVVTSYVTATANLGMTALYLLLAFDLARSTYGEQGAALLTAIACLHLGNALWNAVVASAGLASQPANGVPTVTPVVLTGRSPGGGRWSGLAIQVANF